MPTPELNPLLNPLLGENMGRWAEVYFRSPPEKRDQAVLQLLHELEAENSKRAGAIGTSPSLVHEPGLEAATAPASQFVEAPQTTARCQNCGRQNPATHRFCGMCGKPVAPQTATSDLHIADLHVADLHIADLRGNPPQNEPAPIMRSNESQFIPPAQSRYEPASGTNDLPLFQSSPDIDYSDHRVDHGGDDHGNDHIGAYDAEIFTYPAARRSYRVYVGLALAAVIVTLGYIAWRSFQNTQSTHVEPQSPPAVETQPSALARTSPGAPTTDMRDPTTRSTQPATVPSQRHTEIEKRAARAHPPKAAKARATIAPPTTAEKSPGTPGTGAEELAMAQSYLNGTNGQERNLAEAAKWLWKAVGKQNADATLVLSDLYLKGDGVGKNCEQARVLLDAAARKGKKEAGERLRHLQAFGCQ